jgi:hypothetical protein
MILNGTHQLTVYAVDSNVVGDGICFVKKNAEAFVAVSKNLV